MASRRSINDIETEGFRTFLQCPTGQSHGESKLYFETITVDKLFVQWLNDLSISSYMRD